MQAELAWPGDYRRMLAGTYCKAHALVLRRIRELEASWDLALDGLHDVAVELVRAMQTGAQFMPSPRTLARWAIRRFRCTLTRWARRAWHSIVSADGAPQDWHETKLDARTADDHATLRRDVESALRMLDDQGRKLAEAVMSGESLHEAACRLGLDPDVWRSRLRRLLRHLAGEQPERVPSLTDVLWERVQHLFPPRPVKAGQRPARDRDALSAIVYCLRSGIPLEALPPGMRISGATARKRFFEWKRDGRLQKALEAISA